VSKYNVEITGWKTGGSEFDSLKGRDFTLLQVSRPILRLTQPPVEWIPGALYHGVRRQGREADNSLQSGAGLRMCGFIFPFSASWLFALLSIEITKLSVYV
jgi:hypothetical protein